MRVVDLPRKAPVPRELEESTMNNTTNTGGPAFPHDPDAQLNTLPAQIRAGEDAVIANLQSIGLARTERDRPASLAASEASQARAKRENAKAKPLTVRQAAPDECRQFWVEGRSKGDSWDSQYVAFSGYYGSYGPHLFAAAPEMLAALKAIVDCAGPGAGPEIGLALDAIQKATGETHEQ